MAEQTKPDTHIGNRSVCLPSLHIRRLVVTWPALGTHHRRASSAHWQDLAESLDGPAATCSDGDTSPGRRDFNPWWAGPGDAFSHVAGVSDLAVSFPSNSLVGGDRHSAQRVPGDVAYAEPGLDQATAVCGHVSPPQHERPIDPGGVYVAGELRADDRAAT